MLWANASAGKQYWGVEESDAWRKRYLEDMKSGSPYLASMGVRKGKRDTLGREWIYLMIDRIIGG